MLVVASLWSFSRLLPTSGVCSNVRIRMLISLVVDFDPITAEMGSGTTWHPHHVLSALGNVACLRRSLQIKIQLSRLIRLRLSVHDRGLSGAIHKQCYPVNARLQSL